MDAQHEPDDLASLAAGARRSSPRVRLRLGIGAAVVLLIASLVVAAAVTAFSPSGGTERVTAVTAATGAPGVASSDAPHGPTGAAGSGSTGEGASVQLYVHVLGAVAKPGLYRLHSGARVVDAIAAAGGFVADAEQGGVNLARELADGEQLVVPHIGEAADAAAAPPGAPGVAGGGSAAPAVVNLNTATLDQLESLPRIGPSMAQRILDWRTTNGRFRSVEDLMNVSGIGQKTFDGLKDQVTV
ncbi:ComEA family DNA-binding protein [Microbacterium sp. STN6]|uniref:ComEA family DNA-binding protein n=1 Tax=Microbacterium sp. STN6 TaxID=2995588 RepID=UPI002260ECBC|nr:ComEA family DNA-binding protein [Microbacterium sp. STN6]MCX7522291.1 ComEA family DNA-binding protein [Microbacterium sp. STN6]